MYRKIRNTPKGPEEAIKASISILAFKENTAKELYDKLIERGFSKEDASYAVKFVVDKSYLSERRYFIRFAEHCAKIKHFGRRRIIQEARRKNFADETIEKYADEAFEDIDFDGSCYEALIRSRSEGRKTTEFLLRRGFSAANIRSAYERYEFEHGVPFNNDREDPAGDFSALDDDM